jgi:hypothetical protein
MNTNAALTRHVVSLRLFTALNDSGAANRGATHLIIRYFFATGLGTCWLAERKGKDPGQECSEAGCIMDTRLTRTVPLKNERLKLELSWEAFNVLNRGNVTAVRTQQYAVSTGIRICGARVLQCLVPQVTGLSAFGTPVATSGPRIMQLAARLSF